MEEATKREMARLMLAYIGTFVVQVVFQIVGFLRAAAHYKNEKKRREMGKLRLPPLPPFDRRTDPLTYAGDRCVGNYLEWTPMFLTLVGLDAFVADGNGLWTGWIVVAARCLYPILAVYGNAITRKGVQPLIYLATGPMYLTYLYLASRVYARL